MRAVKVTAGPHAIRWTYQPLTFRIGAALSLLGLMALVYAARKPR